MTRIAIVILGVLLVLLAVALFLPVTRAARASSVEQRNRALAASARAHDKDAGASAGAKPGRISRMLDAAGLDMSVGNFLSIAVLGTLVLAFVGFGMRGAAGAVIGAACALAVLWLWVRSRTRRRKGAFEQQLGECLPMVAEGIRGGMTFERAIRNVADYMDDPIKSQFKLLALERSYGMPLDVAVNNMAERVQSRDMDMLASVVAVQMETGGGMADILDSIAETIQRRNHLRKHVAAVTADGRLSAGIIGAIPVVLFLILNVVAPEYAGVLTQSPEGWAILAVSAAMVALGLFFIRRLYQIKIY